ncbi:DUF402 domain-containing protein [Nonomuraea sp. NPDC050556]|uniref:DUF402 domain-containing protein n=1 Tax=Nonomuraea sp. NPDC050556 TaxID=3364369 RepID=UPI0037B3FCD9
MTEVRVVYTKYDGSLHWNHTGRLLGEDEHGVWVGCTAGTMASKGHEPPVTYDLAFVILFPRDEWWTALFNAEGHKMDIYCDITTVPVWLDNEVTMVDLDLDVVLRNSGKLYVDDEDEFAEHQVLMRYPPHVVAAAEASAEWLMKAVAEKQGPFGGAHLPWLSQVA